MQSAEQAENREKTEPLPENRSVIVLSDFHLGLKERNTITPNFLEFCAFLDRVYSGGTGNPDVIVDGRPKKLLPPAKIILLGDFFDLWSPWDNKRTKVLEDSYSIIRFLFALPAQIVYVTGNHDDEVAEVAGSFPVPVSQEKQYPPFQKNPVVAGIAGSSPGSGETQLPLDPIKLVVAERHYPPEDKKDPDREKEHPTFSGMRIGNHQYFFMHGHQFDLLYITVGLLQKYPGWVSKNYSLFRDHPPLKWFFWILFGLSFLYVAVGKTILKISTGFDGMADFLLGLSLVIYVFTLQPLTLRHFWDIINGRLYPKTATIATVIEAGYWRDGEGKYILADTVVFGHTHVADDSGDRYRRDNPVNKRFINSGSWGDERTPTSDGLGYTEKDTFLYIDAEGPVLFRWPDGGPLPEQISKALTGGSISSGPIPSKLRLWIRRNMRSGG